MKQVKLVDLSPVNVTAVDADGERFAVLVHQGETVDVPDDFADPRFVPAAAAVPPAAPAPAPVPVPEPSAAPAAPSQE